MSKLINGPVNAVRLSGNIFGINKIVYVYMDVHKDVNNESKCDAVISYDFTQYLYNELTKSKNKDIDFFLEIYDIDIESYKKIKHNKYKYIDEVRKFFSKNILIKNNKTIGTSIQNNVRFHYIDIRNYLDKFIYTKLQLIHRYLIHNQFEEVDTILIEVKDEFLLIKDLFNNNKPDKPDKPDKFKNDKHIYYTSFYKLVDKLKNRYNHKEIKKVINYYLSFVDKEVNKITKLISKFTKILKDKNINIKQLIKINDKLFISILKFFSLFVDLYFIRRILDKDYINTILSYTGSAHAANIIYILVKYFDFTVTHIADQKQNENIPDYINKLKNFDLKPFQNNNKLTKIIYPSSGVINVMSSIQCSDLSHFPEF
jgi:hypothetical protein